MSKYLAEIEIHAKMPKTGISDLRNTFPPSFGRPTPGWEPTELPINHPRWPLLVRMAWRGQRHDLTISSYDYYVATLLALAASCVPLLCFFKFALL